MIWWVLLSLLTAVFASVQEVVAKRSIPGLGAALCAWGWVFFSVPFMAILLCLQGPVVVRTGFWPALAAGGALLTVSGMTMFRAIEAGELSRTLPILSFTPFFMLVTSPLIVGEFPRPCGVTGILLIMAGSCLLYYDSAEGSIGTAFRRLWGARSSRLMLVTAFLFSIGANIDKVGVLKSSPLVWAVALNLVVSVGMGVIVFSRTPDVLQKLRLGWPWLMTTGFFAAIMMAVQMTALTMAPASYVIAVKRTSILFSSLAGFWFFKEPGAHQRLPAIVLMLAGIFVISFFN